MMAGIRQVVPQARESVAMLRWPGGSAPIRFAGSAKHTPTQLDAFLNSPRSSVNKLSVFLKNKAVEPHDQQAASALLQLVLKTDQPEETAREIHAWFTHKDLNGFFDLIHLIAPRYQEKEFGPKGLALLKLLYLASQTGTSSTSQQLSRHYAQCLLEKPNAEALAVLMVPRFEQEFKTPDASGTSLVYYLRQLENELGSGPVSKLKSLFNGSPNEDDCRKDFHCLLDSNPKLEDLEVFLRDLMLLEKQDSSLKDIVELASHKFLETLDRNASETRGIETFFPNRQTALEPQQKLVEKQKALLAFSTLQQLRNTKIQPPDILLEGLLKRFAEARITLKGRDVPTSYSKPVFPPAAEVKYLETLLASNRSMEFALDVLKYYSGRNMIAEKAKLNLLALVREPSFEWDLKDRNTSQENVVLLGKLLQQSCRRGNEAFYADLRDTILELAEVKTGKNVFTSPRLPNPSEDPISGPALARDMLRQFVFEMKRNNIPADLLEPLTAKSLMSPIRPSKPAQPAEPAPPVNKKPKPAYDPQQPFQPPIRKPPKKVSFWDAILDYFAWKRIKNK